jgi:hypothetical protein
MKLKDAQEALAGTELVALYQAPLVDAKRIQQTCLDADIPVLLGGEPSCGKGCVIKAFILAREDDAGRVIGLLRDEWKELALAEGTVPHVNVSVIPDEDPDGNPPCPACGCTGALVEGACPECGLTLE